jgi:hypothetical protein
MDHSKHALRGVTVSFFAQRLKLYLLIKLHKCLNPQVLNSYSPLCSWRQVLSESYAIHKKRSQ